MSTPPVEAPSRRQRRFAPSVRGLLLAVAMMALLIGWQTNRARARRRAVEAIERAGGFVLYDYQTLGARGVKVGTSPVPRWLRENLGDDYFSNVKRARLGTGGPPTVTEDDLTSLGALDHVEELALERVPITDAGLARLAGLKDLRWLSLMQDWRVTDAGLAHLSGMTQLETLNLIGTGVTGPGLAHLAGLKNLRYLYLSTTPMTDAGLVHVRGLANLQHLMLLDTKVTDAGLVHLAGLRDLNELEIGSDAPTITDAGLAHLAGMRNLPGLWLKGPGITDAGLAHLAGLKGLQYLRIHCPKVTDAGLAIVDGMPDLRLVDLSGTATTDAGLSHFRGRTMLQNVFVGDTAVTDQGAAALDATLPMPVTITGRPPAPPASPPAR